MQIVIERQLFTHILHRTLSQNLQMKIAVLHQSKHTTVKPIYLLYIGLFGGGELSEVASESSETVDLEILVAI